VCTILLRLDPGSDEPVVVAANRDEFRKRPTDDPSEIAPGVFAGRDRQAGGTWLAVRAGGLAAVTNIGGVPRRPDARSRGELPLAALAGRLPDNFAAFNAFNLLVVDADGARVFTHPSDGRSAEPVPLGPGIHVIVNEPFALVASKGGPRERPAAALLANATPSRRGVRDRVVPGGGARPQPPGVPLPAPPGTALSHAHRGPDRRRPGV
jgi:uncharacterized protein with NRDE domain